MAGSLTRDLQALYAALDSGDDSVLPILADALEESGDPLAASMRGSFLHKRPELVLPNPGADCRWGWQIGYGQRHNVARNNKKVLAALSLHLLQTRWGDWFLFPTRSWAYMALAEARLRAGVTD
jgi:hypothetical protein